MKRQVAERRNNQRTEIEKLGPLVEMELCKSPAVIKNISSSGLACVTENQIDEMTMVEMSIQLPGLPKDDKQQYILNCAGAVVRSEIISHGNSLHKWLTAIFFTEIDKKNKDLLFKYINNRSK